MVTECRRNCSLGCAGAILKGSTGQYAIVISPVGRYRELLPPVYATKL